MKRRNTTAMFTDATPRSDFADLARDPLTRLVMASDGVTEAAFVAVLDTARQAVAARMATAARREPVPRRARGLRVVPSAPARSVWM
jgi:hypothetical protein